MSSTAAKLLVFASSQLACVKIQGKANFVTSIEFKNLINELLGRDYKCLVLDLSECALMDSTFLGVLAGYGMKLHKQPDEAGQPPHGIEILNASQRIIELLDGLGVLHLFRVLQVEGVDGRIQEVEFSENMATSKPSKEEVTLNCLEAHRLLMELNPANVSKFKDVTAFLAEDLKRIQGAQ